MKFKLIITYLLLAISFNSMFAQSITVTPKKAYDYYNEVGINTHLRWDTSVYYTRFDDIIYPELQKLGIRNVRDELPYSKFMRISDTALVQKRFLKLHDSLGINMCFLLTSRLVVDTPMQRDSAAYLSVLENSAALRNATKYMEGYNEPDMNIYNWYPVNWDTLTYNMQRGLYNRMQSGVLSFIPTLSASFIEYWSVPSRTDRMASMLPPVRNYFDFANFHSYDTGKDSSTMFPGSHYDITDSRYDTIRRSKPWVLTETGYENARYWNLPATASYSQYGNHYLSELATAKYCSVLFMEMFGRGAKTIYTYELMDQNTSDSAYSETNFGLLHSDGTEKPSFTAIKNTLSLLKDTSAAFSPIPLTFSLTGDTAGIKYAVYQKYNGNYILALWQGISTGVCYDFLTFTDLPADSQLVQVTFPFQYTTANVYQPLHTDAPLYSYSNTNIFNVAVPDHLLLIEVSPELLSVPASTMPGAYSIYPNPSKDLFYVKGLHTKGEEFFIYSADGRQVLQGTVQSGSSAINCTSLCPGFYLLKLKSEHGITDLVTGISIAK